MKNSNNSAAVFIMVIAMVTSSLTTFAITRNYYTSNIVKMGSQIDDVVYFRVEGVLGNGRVKTIRSNGEYEVITKEGKVFQVTRVMRDKWEVLKELGIE
jgi:hypothetical protein